MKIMVMTDMEGVAGLMDSDNWCHPPSEGHPGRYYELGKQLLTEEVNAAVDGLCDAGADDLVVADGHGAGGINPLLLDRRCKLMRGWPEKWPFGLDASYARLGVDSENGKYSTLTKKLSMISGSFSVLESSFSEETALRAST